MSLNCVQHTETNLILKLFFVICFKTYEKTDPKTICRINNNRCYEGHSIQPKHKWVYQFLGQAIK